MSEARRFDVVCIGAGIVGLATSRALAERYAVRVAVVEAEASIAFHQTGHNSGVLHSGLYYKPGSLKARNCVEGRRRMVELCETHSIPHDICGKVVVATEPDEIPRLDELERRGRANGLQGLVRLGAEQITDYEPHATGLDALWVPETGIVDFGEVAATLARLLQDLGGEIHLGHRVTGLQVSHSEVAIETTGGRILASSVVNCGGLESDRLARLGGARPGVRIVPFRGDYFELAEHRRSLVRGLIYPVPDPRFPFLGVHLTRRVDGSVEAGPNAVLALRRDGYHASAFDLRDTLSTLTWPGFWRLALRFWRIGLGEMLRAGSRQRFARDLKRFVPQLESTDLAPGGCGIRAQALDRRGRLLDDFALDSSPRMLHVLNAPSPAATASLAIGDTLAERAGREFSLSERRG